MTLTPAPVPGNTIMATWGTEIRNRTVQVFASQAELDAWAAPTGALAYRTDTRRYYARQSSAWWEMSMNKSGRYLGQTTSASILRVPHNLGVVPRGVQITPTHFHVGFSMVQIDAVSTMSIDVVCRDFNGFGLDNVGCEVYWDVSV